MPIPIHPGANGSLTALRVAWADELKPGATPGRAALHHHPSIELDHLDGILVARPNRREAKLEHQSAEMFHQLQQEAEGDGAGAGDRGLCVPTPATTAPSRAGPPGLGPGDFLLLESSWSDHQAGRIEELLGLILEVEATGVADWEEQCVVRPGAPG